MPASDWCVRLLNWGTRALADVLIFFVLMGMFHFGFYHVVDIISVNVWFIHVFVCVVDLTIVFSVFRFTENTVLRMVKLCDIYKSSDKECKYVACAFSRVISRFRRIVEVPVFTNMVHTAVSDLADVLIMSARDGAGENLDLQQLVSIVSNTKFQIVSKCSRLLSRNIFRFLDECIFSYCFSNPASDMIVSTKQAFIVFLKHFSSVSEKLFTISVIELVLHFLCGCAGVAYFFHGSSVYNAASMFLALRFLAFVFEDSTLEPWLMAVVFEEFIGRKCDSDDCLEQILLNCVAGYRECAEYQLSDPGNSMQKKGVNEFQDQDGETEDLEN